MLRRFPEALRRAVEGSEAFVFVISPDSVRSSFCQEEVRRAAELNKRLVPLERRPVNGAEAPEEVRFRNWIAATDDAEFDTSVDRSSPRLVPTSSGSASTRG